MGVDFGLLEGPAGQRQESINDAPFLNSFQSWLDGPIDEHSWQWVQDAYNRSLQGMTEEMITGKKRYKLDAGYEPNVLEDIGSTALSFMMPLDFLAMAAGGAIGRGGLALAGVNVALERQAGKAGLGYIIPQMVQQASALATYEGALGGVQAKMNDEDVWKGIGEGAIHGGVMGGLAGAVGGGLAHRNAELISKLQTKGKLAFGTKKATEALTRGERASLIGTGMAGQLGAEAGVFTAAEQTENVMNGGDFRYEEAAKSYFKNLGLFGVLKAKHKVIEKVFDKGKAHLDLLEASEREKLGIKEDGTSSEGRQFDNIIQEFIKSEQSAREKGEVGQAEYFKELREKYLAEKAGVDPQHQKNLEEYRMLRSSLESLKKSGPISENTIVDYKNTLKRLIGVEDRLLKGADDTVAPFYKRLKGEFEQTLKELLELDRESSGDHSKTDQRIEFEWDAPDIVKANSELKVPQKIDHFNLENQADRIQATRQVYEAMMREARLEAAKTEVPYNEQLSKELERHGLKKELSYPEIELESIKQGYTDLKKINKIKSKKLTERTDQEQSFFNKAKDTNVIIEANISPQAKNLLTYSVHNSPKAISKKGIDTATNIVKFAEKKYGQNISELSSNKLQSLFVDYINNRVGTQIINPTTYKRATSKALKKQFGGDRAKAGEAMAEYNRTLNSAKQLFHFGAMKDALKFNILFSEQPSFGKKGEQIGLYQTKGRKEITMAGGEEGLRQLSQATKNQKESFKFKDGKKEIEMTPEEVSLLIEIGTDSKGRTTDFHEIRVRDFIAADKQLILEGKADTKYRVNLQDSTIEVLNKFIAKNNLGKNDKLFSHESTTGLNNLMKEVFGRAPQQLKPEISDTWTGKKYSYDKNIKTGTIKIGELELGGYSVTKGVDAGSIFRRTFGIRGDGKETHGHTRESTLDHYDKSGEAKNIETVHHQLESASSILGTTLKELKTQIKYFKEKYPDFEIYLKDNLGKFQGEYILGRVAGYTAEISRGRARADTIPHEVSHHVIDILRAFGDKKSKDLIREGESKFKSEEGLVQAIGEFVAGRMRNKSMESKVKNWLQKFWSNMKTKLGIHNEADVVRLLGEKVIEGKMPKGKLADTTIKYQTSKEVQNVMTRIKAQKLEDKIDRKVKHKIMMDVFNTTNLKGKLKNATVEQMHQYEKLLNDAISGGKNTSVERLKIPEVNDKYGVSPEASAEILKLMGVKEGMYEYASKETAQEYASYIRRQYDVPIPERISANDVIDLSKTKFSGGIRGTLSYMARGMMPVWLVLRRYGGKPGLEISKRLLNHEWAEHVLYKGEGDKRIYMMKERLGKKSKYIHLFDKERAKRNYEEGNLTAEEKSFYENVYVKKNKNSDEYKAHQTWNNLAEFYWRSLETELSRHQTPQGVQRIMKELDRKKVDGYMTRRLSRKGLEHITEDSNFITELVEKNIRGGAAKAEAKRRLKGESEEDIKILEDRLKDISTREGQEFYENIRTDLYNAVAFGYTNVKNPHLIERGDLLPEYVKINENGKMKEIKVYDDSLGATAETYVSRMSKYLASVRHFPEWTGVGNKYKIDTTKRSLMEQMENNPDMGGYAVKAIKRQLGVDRSDMQALNQPTYRFLGAITNTSAAMGLSSPLSGLKNLMIGIPRSIGDFGFMNTMRGIKHSFDSTAWHDARGKGYLEYGAKTLELETVGWEKANMAKLFRLNLMTRTENINRIVSSHAGQLYFAQAQSVLRGEGSMFKMGTNKKRMKRLMEELWHLEADQIEFLEKTKDFGTKEALSKHAEIMHKVGHFSHVSSQGGTSAVLLPLWMSSKEVKPFTLFQRMATATTIDTYRNFVKPAIEFGNFMPLARAALAHSVSGAALYYLYDELFGKTKPVGSKKMQGDQFDNILMNIWRSEFFGVFGEVLSPYDRNLSVPISTPIIVRNLKEAGNAYRQVMLGGKTISQAAKDYTKSTFVLGAQLFDAFPKAHTKDLQGNKYYQNFMKLRSFKHKWTMEVHNQSPWSADQRISKREPFYKDLRYALMFETEDKIGQRYWQAVNAVTGAILKADNYKMPWKAAKEARAAVEKVIKDYDPYRISDDIKGTTKSKQDQFLDWLTPENKAMAIDVKKQYEFRLRQYKRIIADSKHRNLWSAYPGI